MSVKPTAVGLALGYAVCRTSLLRVVEEAESRGKFRASYLESLRELLAAGSYVGIATHDDSLIDDALRLVERYGLRADRYEFQMLLGVRESRGNDLVAAGHRLRIYIPFGRRWCEYSLRRLQESPKVARYIAAVTVSRLLPRPDRR